MTDWTYAQSDPSEELAQLHSFSMKARRASGEVEIVITVREYATRNKEGMRFFAQADTPVTAGPTGFRPFGWGDTMLVALTECMRAIRQG